MTTTLPWRVSDGAGRAYTAGRTSADVVCGARLVCHGIIPLGLSDAWQPGAGVRGEAWRRLAPALECACAAGRDERWSGGELAVAMIAIARTLAPTAPECPPAIVEDLADDVLAKGVRGYGQAVEAVYDWLVPERLCDLASRASGYAWSARAGDRLALQVVKEGQVSSVVVVTLRRPGGRVIRFVVNVARDAEAADAQAAVARQLAMFAPADAVRVLAEGEGRVRWFGRELPVAMLAVSFAPGAEIHPLAPEAPAGGMRLLRVTGFDEAPGALVPAVWGRLLPAAAVDALWSALAAARTRAARFGADGACAPSLELANGDVVAEAAGMPIVVATAIRPWRGPSGWWPWHVILSSARDDHGGAGRLWWNAPRRAIESVAAALPAGAPPVLRLADAVPEAELAHIVAAQGAGAIPAGLVREARAILRAASQP